MLRPQHYVIANNELPSHEDAQELMIIVPDPYCSSDFSQKNVIIESTYEATATHFAEASLSFRIATSFPHARYLMLDWKKSAPTPFEARWICHKMLTRFLAAASFSRIAFFLPSGFTDLQLAFADDLYLQGFSSRYEKNQFETFRWITENSFTDEHKKAAHLARVEGIREYRRWTNENPGTMTSFHLGDLLQQFAIDHKLPFEKMRASRLEEERLHLLAAVGRASEESPARLFTVTHNCDAGSRPLVLIGKGITFDTGGINLKASEPYLNTMKNDMAGAALMANLFMSLVKAGYKGPLALVIPACENSISHNSIKPGTILQARNGKTVIIQNTDAEGRLILADAINWSEEKFSPSMIITAATLTAASLTQYSSYVTPVYFAPPEFQQKLGLAARGWGEEFSFQGEFMPFKYANENGPADLTNTGRLPQKAEVASRSNIAAHFLKQFTQTPYIHFDIFCTTWNWAGDYPGAGYGATGSVFNSLYDTLLS
jgi:leucyl aminopeptidase